MPIWLFLGVTILECLIQNRKVHAKSIYFLGDVIFKEIQTNNVVIIPFKSPRIFLSLSVNLLVCTQHLTRNENYHWDIQYSLPTYKDIKHCLTFQRKKNL